MRMLIPLALAALMTLAPVMAQETEAQPTCPEGQVETPEGCSQQAWADDCPPDAVCIASEEPQAYGNESCIECSGPVDEPREFGNESCIECSNPPGSTCMDGAQEGEDCDDVQYIGDPVRGPADGSCESCRGEESDTASDSASADKDAPGAAVAWGLIGLAAIAAVARRN